MKSFLRVESEDDLRRRLWKLFVGVVLLEVFLGLGTPGSKPDISNFVAVNDVLRSDPLHVYGIVNQGEGFAWPYPPGYFPMVVTIGEVVQQAGFGWGKFIRVPEIAAAIAIAWLVQWHLGWRGHSPRARLIAAAMVALHPAVIAVSSMHGQIDPVQWLPAVGAIIAWERLPEGRRAVVAGLLIGLAASMKPPPALVLLALLPLAASMRERMVLAAGTAAVPLVMLAPFLAADFSGTLSFLDYNGVPGHGGISLLVQPDLALFRFAGKDVDGLSGAQELLQDVAPIAVIVAVLAVAVRLLQLRLEPAAGTAALILVVFVFGGNYFPSYAIWLIPFVVLAGWTRFYWVITALMLLPLAFRYTPGWLVDLSPLGEGLAYHEWAVLFLYLPLGAALWAAYAWRLASLARSPGAR